MSINSHTQIVVLCCSPPPASGLSEKYSNNVDATLASDLEARSYQPGLNSYKESTTLVSLKRRNAPEGLVRDDSGPDPSPPPATTPEKTVSVPFTDDDVSTMNLASTISNAINGGYTLLDRWSQNSLDSTLDAVKSVLGDDKYSEVEPGITKRIKEWKDDSRKGTHDIADYTSRILGDDGTVIENLQKIGKASQNIIESRGVVFWILKDLLENFGADKTLGEQLDGILVPVHYQQLPTTTTTTQYSTSIAHLVVDCEQVTGHRIQSGLLPAIQKSRLRLLGRSLDPGVENVYTWLRGGVLNGEADLDQRWLDGTVEHESMGTRHDNWVLTARVG
ncbi:hypothetical protein BASA81_014857 [Batrachochytrium salamandrivorans]|nr:hypothetical protein BASA81_014857 [Batrachochytrium salamandrivorans]